MSENITIRQARLSDEEDVVAFTQQTWEDRGGGDYIPRVFTDWVESDDETQHTFVATIGDEVAGLVQAVLLSDYEAWGQGLRVNPEFRGQGVSRKLTFTAFDWARERGASVFRNMVFSSNIMGLGQSKAVGYEPVAEFRWSHPEPNQSVDPGMEVSNDPKAAWQFWIHSESRTAMSGLGLDPTESWAFTEITRDRLETAATNGDLFVVSDSDGVHGFAYKAREYERERDEETEFRVEYGIGAWENTPGALALYDVIREDAANRGADTTRVVIPETKQALSDSAYARVDLSDEPDFIMAADLTGSYRQ
ncbi:MAG: GNAT family N-acetyltransferase [Halobacteriaceae archaeon]